MLESSADDHPGVAELLGLTLALRSAVSRTVTATAVLHDGRWASIASIEARHPTLPGSGRRWHQRAGPVLDRFSRAAHFDAMVAAYLDVTVRGWRAPFSPESPMR